MKIPDSVVQFLSARRIAVAGVSHDARQPANAIFRRLKETGHDVVPVNPHADELEGVACWPSVAAVPGPLDAVLMAAPPAAGVDVIRQCAERGVRNVWFHRSIGDGSVAEDAVAEAGRLGINAIVGGCPMMYCGKVDVAHRCMCLALGWFGRIPE